MREGTNNFWDLEHKDPFNHTGKQRPQEHNAHSKHTPKEIELCGNNNVNLVHLWFVLFITAVFSIAERSHSWIPPNVEYIYEHR